MTRCCYCYKLTPLSEFLAGDFYCSRRECVERRETFPLASEKEHGEKKKAES